MGEGCMALAARAADVCVVSADLRLLPQSVALCRFARRLVRLNLTLVATVKAASIIGALLGKLPLWLAVLADLGSLLLVLFIGGQALRYKCWGDAGTSRANANLGEGIVDEHGVVFGGASGLRPPRALRAP